MVFSFATEYIIANVNQSKGVTLKNLIFSSSGFKDTTEHLVYLIDSNRRNVFISCRNLVSIEIPDNLNNQNDDIEVSHVFYKHLENVLGIQWILLNISTTISVSPEAQAWTNVVLHTLTALFSS